MKDLVKKNSYVIISILLLTSMFGGVAFGLWLPWATEEDKVKKTVQDVWQYLILKDKRSLREIIGGVGGRVFIENELALIQNLGIKDYQCQFRRIVLDPAQEQVAFAEYDRIAEMKDGTKIITGMMSVLQKVDGEWKFMPNYRTKSKKAEKARLRGIGTNEALEPRQPEMQNQTN